MSYHILEEALKENYVLSATQTAKSNKKTMMKTYFRWGLFAICFIFESYDATAHLIRYLKTFSYHI